MEELPPIKPSSFDYNLINVPKVQNRIEFLVDRIILNWAPVVVSDFVISYAGVTSLDYDNKWFYFIDENGLECQLRESEKAKIQCTINMLQGELLWRISKSTNLPWIPHYINHTDSESWESQLLLQFRMRESWQLIDGTRDAVNEIYV